MTVRVLPTLAVMADVYRRSTAGGDRSERFRAYVDAGRSGAPVHGYNPMTSKPVLPTVEALIDAGVEERLVDVADRVVRHLGEELDAEMYVTVATPGMWTDRLATEVEHRLLARDPRAVVWWFDEEVDVDAVDAEIAAQAVRLVLHRRGGAPATLTGAVRQEGLAGQAAGRPGRHHDAAAEALEVLADDPHLGTMVAYLYGDAAAATMGFTPLGLADRVGTEHAVWLSGPAWRR